MSEPMANPSVYQFERVAGSEECYHSEISRPTYLRPPVSKAESEPSVLLPRDLKNPPLLHALALKRFEEHELQSLTLKTMHDLPTKQIDVQNVEMRHIAVLSWRWDPELLNLSIALRFAKQKDIHYLFTDFASVDQSLHGDELLAKVVEFSTLFRILPVIAAYDHPTEGMLSIMRRPWIVSEGRAFRFNSCRITYVGHSHGGASQRMDPETVYWGAQPLGRVNCYWFGNMLERIWRSDYEHTILEVLCKNISMYSISDFKFIMPMHARVLTLAFEKMTSNDYLLTAAILCNTRNKEPYRVNESSDITLVQFDRYSLREADGGEYDNNQDVLLDGIKVATWLDHYNLYMDFHRRKIQTMATAEREIFVALGFSEAEYDEYAAQADLRSENVWHEGHHASDSYPHVEIYRLMRPINEDVV